ncbi:gamma-glutamyltransferase [Algicola sagamiensis]|uniref:gamma-glutamyltransferase n=1 Tax=Algicola sagamiensis TaxID=163869 RepID=UPI000379B456|nr:gamma-glutamyltransferase [Algicola sagamiensis]
MWMNPYAMATESAIFSQMDISQPIWAKKGMVASQEATASKVGLDILKQGGNAVDAAVAVGFTLAVTLPRAGNLGGGGFMMVYLKKENKAVAIDYREVAPLTAHRDIFLDKDGNPDSVLSRYHGLAVGVPGTVMGMEHALKKYGTMTLAQVMAPAIKLAEEGFPMTSDLSNSLKGLHKRLTKFPSAKRIFYKKDGSFYEAGEIWKQPELAKTMKKIAKNGSKAFYEGEVAEKIVKSVTEAGGLMSMKDLATYQVKERAPVEGEYKGHRVISMPPPSSGGIHIIQMLNMLKAYPLSDYGHNSAQSIHTMAEVMKRAYADRSEYLGDPDFTKVPVTGLTSQKYADSLRKTISQDKATPSKDIRHGNPAPYESNETTHYSVVDRFGNAVSNTYTLNFSYGSGLVADGAGFLLNNEMDDFSAKPGVPNAYGLIGGDANAVGPKKRPLSSMSPTIVVKNNQPFLVTGSPGGSRIITTTLQMILNVIDHQMNVSEATQASRIHHQWLPDEIRVEKGISPDTLKLLKAKGQNVKVKAAMGSTQSIMVTEQGLFGASDPRRSGSMTVGY